MRKLRITWKSSTPLIMHSCKCVNPLHPISIEMKKYTSKRNKTEEDLKKISDLEWEAGAYWKDDIGLYIPAENVEATIINGAKAFKKGADIKKYSTDNYLLEFNDSIKNIENTINFEKQMAHGTFFSPANYIEKL